MLFELTLALRYLTPSFSESSMWISPSTMTAVPFLSVAANLARGPQVSISNQSLRSLFSPVFLSFQRLFTAIEKLVTSPLVVVLCSASLPRLPSRWTLFLKLCMMCFSFWMSRVNRDILPEGSWVDANSQVPSGLFMERDQSSSRERN